jgi:hypothetical protein
MRKDAKRTVVTLSTASGSVQTTHIKSELATTAQVAGKSVQQSLQAKRTARQALTSRTATAVVYGGNTN